MTFIISIDGTDKIGKSSLTKKLSQHLKCPSYHFPSKSLSQFESQEEFQQYCLKDMIDNQDMIKSNDMIILDRYVHSLEAYGGVYIDPRDERIQYPDITIFINVNPRDIKHLYDINDQLERFNYQVYVHGRFISRFCRSQHHVYDSTTEVHHYKIFFNIKDTDLVKTIIPLLEKRR